MEAQATAQARRARSLRQGPRQCRSIGASPARHPTTHPRLLQDSRPGGGSRRHDPHWAAPPSRTVHYIRLGQIPTALKLTEPHRRPPDSGPPSLLGIVVPIPRETPLSALFIPQSLARRELGGPGLRARWERSSGCLMTRLVKVVQDYISRRAPRWAGPGSEG